ncbi:hypothetical protein PRK78_001543 [Emydomyces testavorans]|uniref:ATP-grasp domain-containing protein n=1 Tax=Emydomyces testavorans TaxID=2070801 RepID=A0AAF0DD62_9EURO|nr:hypothetical protein PRK78_001543 [Emydomyces testavorans]
MRICVLHSSYEGSDHNLQAVDTHFPDPGAFTKQHTFEHRFIKKENATAQIDAVAAEGFDFYFNFMWGTHEDNVAGIDASRHFESLNLPSVGIRSYERERSKNDFFVDARRIGAPPVPGTAKFPMFVKPAFGCSSQLIGEHSVCHNEEELERTIRLMNEKMRDARLRRAVGLGKDPDAYVQALEEAGKNSEDIVVQEYIEGHDYTVTVVAFGETPVPLVPARVAHIRIPGEKQYLTFEAKFDSGTHYEPFVESTNPVLYRHLQEVAIEAYKTNQMHTNLMGCDVDIRVRPDGQAFAIEVNPMPVAFMPPDAPFAEGEEEAEEIPGGYAAAVNIFITNYFLIHPEQKSASLKIAEAYDQMSPVYNKQHATSNLIPIITQTVELLKLEGRVLDLGCGTGAFGRILSEKWEARGNDPFNKLYGVDISEGMLDVCKQGGWYHGLYIEPIQRFIAKITGGVDHVVAMSVLHHLTPEELTFVLVRCFQLAKKSITLTVDEIPDEYNQVLHKRGLPHMHSNDQLKNVKAMGEPAGWRLSYLRRQFGWTSPATGVQVYVTVFHFERYEKEDPLKAAQELIRYGAHAVASRTNGCEANGTHVNGIEASGSQSVKVQTNGINGSECLKVNGQLNGSESRHKRCEQCLQELETPS